MAAEPAPIDPSREEVRIAMALNGGVSLAVWMGGCAVELDCARRAWAGPETLANASTDDPRNGTVKRFMTGERTPAPPPPVPPVRRVYAALCDALHRRLVIDLMSGASAGGINGALLAAATVHGRRLHPDFIRSQWVELGDFDRLLQPTSAASPRSLMQGDLFHAGLESAFEGLLGEDPLTDPSPGQAIPPEAVKLDVTTTDIVGARRTFRDAWGHMLIAREHRARFRFRDPEADYTATRLAQAARASASFPVAFEPWEVSASAGTLAGFDGPRWVVDGGLLDNAPIRAVLDLIPSQPADRQVKRYVCYVNADPPEDASATLAAGGPPLPAVLGYVANLPRKAPFVDQLTAIEDATRRSGIGDDSELLDLFRVDGESLRGTAAGLLAPYRRRRRLLSLEELLGSAAAAATAAECLGGRVELPWIPDTFPTAPGTWRWGIRAAQRILQLQLDLLRAASSRTPIADRGALSAARAEVDRQLALLEDQRCNLLADAGVKRTLRRLLRPYADPIAVIDELEERTVGYDAVVAERLNDAFAAFFRVRTQLANVLGQDVCAALFGQAWASTPTLDAGVRGVFERRALAIEVVRRAFFAEEDIDSAQPLRFAQLTPTAPTPVFAQQPERPHGWTTAEDKLTGIELGHFAAFYRRSWRVNDFMWGRLDAAARVIEMLVDPERASELVDLGGDGHPAPWELLAESLMPDEASSDARWIVHEALQAAAAAGVEADAEPPQAEALRVALSAALEDDLHGGNGTVTRAVCTRLAQLEILAHELPVLTAEARGDDEMGSGSGPLELPEGDELRPTICALREEPTLPRRLGRTRGEVGSALAVRTATHAALVSLAAFRGTRLPLADLLYGVRAALLPLAGAVSRVPVYRLGTAIGFWAAALFLAARMLSLDPRAGTDLGLAFSADTMAAVVALFVVAGIASLPSVRFWRLPWSERAVQAATFVALVASGGVAAVVLRALFGDADWRHLIVAPEADHPPEVVLSIGILLLVGPVALRLVPKLPGLLDPLVSKPWAGPSSFVALLVVSLLLGIFSIQTVLAALNDEWWRVVTSVLALLGAPLAIGMYIRPWVRSEDE